MPITAACFLIGTLAICGIPPLRASGLRTKFSASLSKPIPYSGLWVGPPPV
ncbi:hypothetical protein NON20_04750 [Synechocystis sp. B12]|nr:hypothetical protein NON20_04750 [Synechocystis sp. B12]